MSIYAPNFTCHSSIRNNRNNRNLKKKIRPPVILTGIRVNLSMKKILSDWVVLGLDNDTILQLIDYADNNQRKLFKQLLKYNNILNRCDVDNLIRCIRQRQNINK